MNILRSRRLLAAFGAAIVLAGLFVFARGNDNGSSTRFTALFDSTVGLYPGSSVDILGVPVGKVISVTPSGGYVRVAMELDSDQSAAAGTKAVVVAPTLVSDRYVQLTAPYVSGAKLADGTVIQTKDTAVPVELDALYGSLDDLTSKLGPNGANKNGALSDLLKVGAKNLDGNGKKINGLIHDAGKASSTLSKSGDDLFATIGNLDQFTGMLAVHDNNVADVNKQLAAVSGYLAKDRGDFADAVANLGDALTIVDDFIRENRGHLTTSVDNLVGPTQVLVRQKASLEQMVRLVPLAVQNFLRTYDAEGGLLAGRGNLNELTVWSDGNSYATGSTSADSAPLLLPGSRDGR